MELVYLWVEDYKNIKNQGFNFSPKFKCEFDGKKLTITENEDYISIFPENINITAIVGENGSGKSSVLEALSLLQHNHYLDIQKSKNKIFIVFKIETDFYIMSTKDNGYAYKKEFKECENKYFIQVDLNNATGILSGQKYYLSYFSNCLTDMTKQKRFEPFKDKREGGIKYFYNGIQPSDLNKQQFTPFKNKNDVYDYFNVKFADLLKDNHSFFNFLDKNLIFDSYKFEIHLSDLGVYFSNEKLYKNLITLDGNYLFPDINQKNSKSYFYKFMALYIIKESIDIIVRKTNEQYKSQGATIEYINKAITDFINIVKKSFNENCSKKDYYETVLKFCSKYIDEELFSSENIKKLLNDYTYVDNNIWKSENFNIIKKSINHYLDDKILTKLEKDNIFRVDFFKENKEEYNFLSLSSGEQEYLKILTNFSYTMKHYIEGQNNIILFDEIELSMHPNWQKKLINNLDIILKSFKKKNTYTNIIITSHSPFILSDIPKENVIFLKNGKMENPDIKTFGANIHTLLANGFFMSDGLMGEFAKSKINEIKKFYEIVKFLEPKNKKYKRILKILYLFKIKKFKHIQSIIGEAFLQTIIKNYLDELEILFNGKKKFLNKEIKRLEKLRNELR
jgi:predicted ATP-binding protein involved in virulence